MAWFCNRGGQAKSGPGRLPSAIVGHGALSGRQWPARAPPAHFWWRHWRSAKRLVLAATRRPLRGWSSPRSTPGCCRPRSPRSGTSSGAARTAPSALQVALVALAIGETVILLHSPPPLAGVSIRMERGGVSKKHGKMTVSPTAR